MAKRPLTWLLAVVAALGLAACGSSNSGGGGGGGGGGGKKGGSITIGYSSFPDYLDPALAYTLEGWSVLWLTNTPLLTYKHVEGAPGAPVVPGLAEAMPQISPDGKTYKLKLRKGLKYSDGKPVKASDFMRTVQRVLNLESGGSSYYESIAGTAKYLKDKKPTAAISGIKTSDSTGEITITLNKKDGRFNNILATDFGGLVPGDTPFKNLTKNPPPGVGAFKVTKVVPNRTVTIEKNANFKGLPGVPQAKLDKITIKYIKSQSKQVEDVINGQLDYMFDEPTPDLINEVRNKYKDRYREVNALSTYYMFMSVDQKPFNNLKAREAVNYGLDKRALTRIFAGLLAPDCNFIPPGQPGYKKLSPCKYGDPTQPPDLNKAKQLLKESGMAGQPVTVWGDDEDRSTRVTQYYADVLNKIGFKAKPKIIGAEVYFQTIGNQKTHPQTGFADWFQDFPNPANFLFLVNGNSIQDTNNQNYGNVSDKKLTAGIEKGNANTPDAYASQWAGLDKYTVEDQAYVAPYGHTKLTIFMSERMNFKGCDTYNIVYNFDLSSLCLK